MQNVPARSHEHKEGSTLSANVYAATESHPKCDVHRRTMSRPAPYRLTPHIYHSFPPPPPPAIPQTQLSTHPAMTENNYVLYQRLSLDTTG